MNHQLKNSKKAHMAKYWMFNVKETTAWKVDRHDYNDNKNHVLYEPDGLSVQMLGFPRVDGQWRYDVKPYCPARPA